jgi:hypothetical protein
MAPVEGPIKAIPAFSSKGKSDWECGVPSRGNRSAVFRGEAFEQVHVRVDVLDLIDCHRDGRRVLSRANLPL